ncbi:hypothetical protein [Streptomyces sp. NPDC002588]|uniref:hypothetical protein n=1 Tax=Streptomyces sp. NPDC002588 TaxID=3154419 RepID=UPI00331998C3
MVVRDLPVLREVFGHAAGFAATQEDLADQHGQAFTPRPGPADGRPGPQDDPRLPEP